MSEGWHLEKKVTLGLIWTVSGAVVLGTALATTLRADVNSNTARLNEGGEFAMDYSVRQQALETDVAVIKEQLASTKEIVTDNRDEVKELRSEMAKGRDAIAIHNTRQAQLLQQIYSQMQANSR